MRAAIVTLALLLGGCETTEQAANTEPPVSMHGTELSAAQRAMVDAEHGMPIETLRQALGRPDETSGGVYGGRTAGGSWNGMKWIYQWRQYRPHYQSWRLELLFQQHGEGWYLHSWNWR